MARDTLAVACSCALRGLWGLRLRVSARSRRKAFFCTALAGTSGYNICVNSDLTVSCNCNDTDGSGNIGDLREQTLDSIFSGEMATRFRRELAEGRFPTSWCARCADLRMVGRTGAKRTVESFHAPLRALMVENTNACNLRCLSCARWGIGRTRARRSMSLDEMGRVADEIVRSGIRSVNFFNLGEPFASAGIRREVGILREKAPDLKIATSTNGLLVESDEAREAALLFDAVSFSIDGVSTPMVRRYQRGGDFARAWGNMRELVRLRDARGLDRPRVTWKYVLFNWNDRGDVIERAIALGRAAGVDDMLFRGTFSPAYGMSLRYHAGLMSGLGEPAWRGRHVRLR
jgi:pyruvate-formate lyase-activating enzyme